MNENYDQQSHLFLKEEIVWLFFQISRKNNTDILTYRTNNFLQFLKNILDGKNVQDISLDLITSKGEMTSIEFSALIKGKVLFWFARNSGILV